MGNYVFKNYYKSVKIGKIVCLARTYRAHVAEMGEEVTGEPLLFLKPASAIIFNNQSVIIPKRSKILHHEVELGVVIGKKCKNITKEKAMDHVLGYLLALDITARDIQQEAKKLLEDICKNWPKSQKVKFVITCGGFIQFDWPKSISQWEIGDNKNPNKDTMDTLVKEAEKCTKFVLDGGLDKKLSEFTDYITLGIDSRKTKISTTQNYIGQPHIELVFLIDLRNNKTYWTGKSYPTSGQQNGLIRISDLKKHFFELDDVGKVMGIVLK